MEGKLPPDMFRSDGSKKSARGFLGPIVNKRDGKTMTEFTIGVVIDGKELMFLLWFQHYLLKK